VVSAFPPSAGCGPGSGEARRSAKRKARRRQADRRQVRLKAGHYVLRHCEKCARSLRGGNAVTGRQIRLKPDPTGTSAETLDLTAGGRIESEDQIVQPFDIPLDGFGACIKLRVIQPISDALEQK
jgi:hypothetical protein